MRIVYCDFCGVHNTSGMWHTAVQEVELVLPSPDGVNHSTLKKDMCCWCRSRIRIAMDDAIHQCKENKPKGTVQ